MTPRLPLGDEEILETIRMVQDELLDIRTVTLGISLSDCSHPDVERAGENVYRKVTTVARRLVAVAAEVEAEFGVPIVNKRVAVTPIAMVAAACQAEDYTPIALQLDRAAADLGLDFIGGFSALAHKGFPAGSQTLIRSLPRALAATQRVCGSVNVASTRSGINMDAVRLMGETIRECARLTADRDGLACAKLVVFANAPEDNPFMAGAMHGPGEPEATINVGVSGPGVVRSALEKLNQAASLNDVAECIKKTAFKVTRMGELVGREVAQRLGVPFGIVDLSLAPTPQIGDSVADILECMGLERTGAHGTTAALALLVDAVKKGGAFASSSVGGLSGGFIPVSEDAGMIEAVRHGALSLDKLEAMTAVCSVGLDMVAIPGDTPASTIAGIIADEVAIGVINNKTTGVRLIPVPGKGPGEMAEFGGLLGRAPILPVNAHGSGGFVARGGRIPAPLRALGN